MNRSVELFAISMGFLKIVFIVKGIPIANVNSIPSRSILSVILL